MITDPKQVADKFNDYFTNVAKSLEINLGFVTLTLRTTVKILLPIALCYHQ